MTGVRRLLTAGVSAKNFYIRCIRRPKRRTTFCRISVVLPSPPPRLQTHPSTNIPLDQNCANRKTARLNIRASVRTRAWPAEMLGHTKSTPALDSKLQEVWGGCQTTREELAAEFSLRFRAGTSPAVRAASAYRTHAAHKRCCLLVLRGWANIWNAADNQKTVAISSTELSPVRLPEEEHVWPPPPRFITSWTSILCRSVSALTAYQLGSLPARTLKPWGCRGEFADHHRLFRLCRRFRRWRSCYTCAHLWVAAQSSNQIGVPIGASKRPASQRHARASATSWNTS